MTALHHDDDHDTEPDSFAANVATAVCLLAMYAVLGFVVAVYLMHR